MGRLIDKMPELTVGYVAGIIAFGIVIGELYYLDSQSASCAACDRANPRF